MGLLELLVLGHLEWNINSRTSNKWWTGSDLRASVLPYFSNPTPSNPVWYNNINIITFLACVLYIVQCLLHISCLPSALYRIRCLRFLTFNLLYLLYDFSIIKTNNTFLPNTIFTAGHNAACCISITFQSICPSHAGIASKQMNVRWCCQCLHSWLA